MKKLLVLFCVAALSFAFVTIGCDDDDDNDQILNPGDTTAVNYQLFMSEFEGLDQFNGEMFDILMGFIDTLFSGPPAPPSGKGTLNNALDATLQYHSDSKFWYCTFVDTSFSDSVIFSIIDSIQFKHGDSVVQWPDPDLVSEVVSYLTVTATGSANGLAHQNLTIVADSPGSDTINVNGWGDIDADFSYQDIDGTDTTICTGSEDFYITYVDLVFLTGESGIDCPIAGNVGYTGTLELNCTGAYEAGISGDWVVTQVFDMGETTTTVYHGDTYWTTIDYCFK